MNLDKRIITLPKFDKASMILYGFICNDILGIYAHQWNDCIANKQITLSSFADKSSCYLLPSPYYLRQDQIIKLLGIRAKNMPTNYKGEAYVYKER